MDWIYAKRPHEVERSTFNINVVIILGSQDWSKLLSTAPEDYILYGKIRSVNIIISASRHFYSTLSRTCLLYYKQRKQVTFLANSTDSTGLLLLSQPMDYKFQNRVINLLCLHILITWYVKELKPIQFSVYLRSLFK